MRPVFPWYQHQSKTSLKNNRPINLMNTGVKILHNTLANQVQQHIKSRGCPGSLDPTSPSPSAWLRAALAAPAMKSQSWLLMSPTQTQHSHLWNGQKGCRMGRGGSETSRSGFWHLWAVSLGSQFTNPCLGLLSVTWAHSNLPPGCVRVLSGGQGVSEVLWF